MNQLHKLLFLVLLVVSSAAHAESPSPDVSQSSAKVTVELPNNEEKIFRFTDTGKTQFVDLKAKSICGISFGATAKGLRYAQFECGQPAKKKWTVLTGSRVACAGDSRTGVLILSEGKGAQYSFIIECD